MSPGRDLLRFHDQAVDLLWIIAFQALRNGKVLPLHLFDRAMGEHRG